MRTITSIIVHCTGTSNLNELTVQEVRDYHKSIGFSDIGYHFLVHLDGRVSRGRPLEVAGAHCKGRNLQSIGIAYVGGLDIAGTAIDTRTKRQKKAMRLLIANLVFRFPILDIAGHNEYANKACPCFNARKEYIDLL